jgi:hypothetical protein
MNIRLGTVALAAICVSGIAFGQGAPDPRPGATTPVQVMNGASNPVPVTGTVTGTVNVSKTQTIALLEMVGIPMNFQTAAPLDTSRCGSLRIVLKSNGPGLLFTLTTPVGGTATGNTPYFSTLVPPGADGSEVVDAPPPVSNVVMGVSGDCPACTLGVYCR